MLAHSLRLVLPRRIAPASRSRLTRCASCVACTPASASEPAVVHIRSPVATLSFTSTGIPCSGPRLLPAERSASSAFACVNASGLSSMMLFSRGPRLSTAAMRSRHRDTRRSALSRPSPIARIRSVARASSSNRLPAAGRTDGAATAGSSGCEQRRRREQQVASSHGHPSSWTRPRTLRDRSPLDVPRSDDTGAPGEPCSVSSEELVSRGAVDEAASDVGVAEVVAADEAGTVVGVGRVLVREILSRRSRTSRS